MTQTVFMRGVSVHTTSEFRPSAFVFRKDRKHHWLQRLCIWVLDKLGCYDNVLHTHIETHEWGPRQQQAIEKALYAQIREIQHGYRRRPTTLYIGSEDWVELTGNPNNSNIIWDALRFTNKDGNHVLLGCEIRIIPWMKGMLLV